MQNGGAQWPSSLAYFRILRESTLLQWVPVISRVKYRPFVIVLTTNHTIFSLNIDHLQFYTTEIHFSTHHSDLSLLCLPPLAIKENLLALKQVS